MERVYQVLFIAGTTYAVVSTILGGLFDALDIDGDIDMDGDLPWLGVFRPIGIVSFITVFGGLGLFGTHMQYHPVFTLCASAILGGLVSFLIHRFIVVPLRKAENTSAPTKDDLVGLEATVISTIYENGFGTIAYSFKGNRYNSPAKHADGKSIPKGEKVVICDIKNNIYFVKLLEESPKTGNLKHQFIENNQHY